MRVVLAVLMVLHGFAHIPGVIGSWRLAPEKVPPMTTLLAGRIHIGTPAAQVVGGMWLVLVFGFMVTAAGAFSNATWWVGCAAAFTVISLCMSAMSWPEARVGVYVNAAILVAIAVGRAMGRI